MVDEFNFNFSCRKSPPPPQQRTNNRKIRGNDIHHKRANEIHGSGGGGNNSYKAAPGEILAKDSFLYSQHPESRQLRRKLWPIMEETMNSIANSVAAGASALRHIVGGGKSSSPSPPHPTQLIRMRTIKNVYLTSPTLMMPTKSTTIITTYNRQLKPTTTKPMSTIMIDQKPVMTTSEDYLLRFRQEPSYLIKTTSTAPKHIQNPYADMGVTGYKHFEQTVLRELEQKEERKVEATMSNLMNDGKPKINKLEEQLIMGVPYAGGGEGGWKPVRPVASTAKPKPMGKLHVKTSDLDVKPVYEEPQESKGSPPKLMVSSDGELMRNALAPIDAKKTEQLRMSGFKAAASDVSSTSAVAPIVAVADMPNYPEFYLKWANKLVKAKEAKEMDTKGRPKRKNNSQQQRNERRPDGDADGSVRSYVTVATPPATSTTHRIRPNTKRKPAGEATTTDATIGGYTSSTTRGNVKFSNSFPL